MSTLEEVEEILNQVCEAGLSQDLREHLTNAYRRWRDPDRQWRWQEPHGQLYREAVELSELTAAPLADCIEAVKRHNGDSEQQVRIAAILEFAQTHLAPKPKQRRQTARSQW